MTPIVLAYEAGRAARAAGQEATSNPHHDWELGVAWAAGWHGMTGGEYKTKGLRDLVTQNRALRLNWLLHNEGCCPRVGGGA